MKNKKICHEIKEWGRPTLASVSPASSYTTPSATSSLRRAKLARLGSGSSRFLVREEREYITVGIPHQVAPGS